jgi:uncharacterized protein (DUF433 family)
MTPAGGQELVWILIDADLMFIWVMARAFADMDLHAKIKSTIYERIAASRAGPWTVETDDLPINDHLAVRGFRTLVRELRARIETLEKARSLVVSDPEIRGGEPVIRGTRIPVYLVAAMLHQGASVAEILENYPTLTEEAVELARVYARANPKQGRPQSFFPLRR